jgi:hypothetical protein
MTSQTFGTLPKAAAGDRVTILSPAFAAPAVSEAVHEQAMNRLTEITGLIPVEYPTTRQGCLNVRSSRRPGLWVGRVVFRIIG